MPLPYPGVKISELPEATTPLAGTEQVPIVQLGTTKRTSASAFMVFTAGAETTVTTSAGQNNNVSIGAAQRVLVNTAAGAATITGIAGGTDGRVVLITVNGASDLTLANESASSTAGNRLSGSDDLVLPDGVSMFIVYSATLSRWVMV